MLINELHKVLPVVNAKFKPRSIRKFNITIQNGRRDKTSENLLTIDKLSITFGPSA